MATATAVPASSAKQAEPEPAPPVKEVSTIQILDPQGIDFVPKTEWQKEEPLLDRLNRLEHAENEPIMDIVIMHSAEATTADNELSVLQAMQSFHINTRGWDDIAPHYLVGPSGKVYQGRNLRFRYPDGQGSTIGSGMGRFSYAWNKCAIMLMGDFISQEITAEAQQATVALIDDRRNHFQQLYREQLDEREAETARLMGGRHADGTNYGYDVVRVRQHPSLPASVWASINPESGGAEAP
ncbi:N-acetylmuramoyl-L-alanine amidase [Candidatus Peregrinibacteria bacterium]|nr:N-acetylmuramoyl-L-alanine amidase [Candidatus Peregrinibacteria bacterium]